MGGFQKCGSDKIRTSDFSPITLRQNKKTGITPVFYFAEWTGLSLLGSPRSHKYLILAK